MLMFTGVGLIAFCCIFGAGVAGLLLRRILPEDQRTDATQKTVQTMMNVVAILAALVLGLLIASTKTSFDTRSKEIEEFSANLTLLDRELMHLGQGQQEQKEMRALLRDFTAREIAQTWRTGANPPPVTDDVQTVQMLDDVENRLRTLAPEVEIQRAARSSALQLAGELKRTSRLLAVQESGQTPRLFLVVVIFWLSILFISYTIFAPLNATIVATLFAGAFSVSIALNLIFDMDRPFAGLVKVSSVPMQQALEKMKP
jgi:nitrate reductase gamma subunit